MFTAVFEKLMSVTDRNRKRMKMIARTVPASLLLTTLCRNQSHVIADDNEYTSVLMSLAMFSKCLAHSLQPKKLRT